MANVELRQVTKSYDDRQSLAVKPLTFEIQDKEFLVIVGPSGCGKSTTLRMIAGLESITDGGLFIDNNLVNYVETKDRDIAMVFQNYALYPYMTIEENIAFPLKIQKVPRKFIKQRVQKVAEILQLSDLLKRKPDALSGGQRQRVALGRAMVRQPKVFLFDEPLSNLDAKLRVEMRAEIVKLHQQLDTTFIYVTHDQTEAMTMGDRIAVLNKGALEQLDSPIQLYENPRTKFVAEFIGNPQMNVFETQLIFDKQGQAGVSFNGSFAPLASSVFERMIIPGLCQDVYAGIRPEDLYLATAEETGTIRVQIENIEHLGHLRNVFFTVSDRDQTMVASLELGPDLTVGDTIYLKAAPDRWHLFDDATEESLLEPREI